MRMPMLHLLAYRRRDGVDRPRIIKLMNAKGITCAQTAKACGKSRAAIKNKLAGFAAFTVEDIQCFYKILNLSNKEASEIFFGQSA